MRKDASEHMELIQQRHKYGYSNLFRNSGKIVFVMLLSAALTGCGGGNQCRGPVSPAAFIPTNVIDNADAIAFRNKYKAGDQIGIAIIGDSTTLHANLNVLDDYLKQKNSASVVYNYGFSGWQAGTHVANNTVAQIAALSPKPDAVFIAVGINDVAAEDVGANVYTLSQQARATNMLPVLVKENNIACRGNWTPDPYWKFIRYYIDRVATEIGANVIDLGSNDEVVDPALMLDSVHPNEAGKAIILDKYKAWLNS